MIEKSRECVQELWGFVRPSNTNTRWIPFRTSFVAGFTKEETEYLLVDCHYLGINNVMALRGDAMPHQKYFEPTKGGHNYATDLVQQIHKLNKGQYLHDVVEVDNKPDFCIGVAGYPEKHIESPSLHSDLLRLKEKVDAGADYVVTQMFFDNQRYFEFVKKAEKWELQFRLFQASNLWPFKSIYNYYLKFLK